MLWFILLLLSASLGAAPRKLVQSAGVSLNVVNSESELQNKNQKQILTFTPNVATAVGLMLETEYVGVGYSFAGKEAQDKDFPKSKYQDLRVNFHWSYFDFRLNYQNYKGGLVKDNGRTQFYNDYEVKSKNARFHFYTNKKHLKFIREGTSLVERVTMNSGFHSSTSWIAGLNLDERSISLPANLAPEHQAEVNRFGIKYDRSFSAFSAGPLAGFDGMLQYSSAFFRGKVAGGPAFQTGGGTVPQFEFALNTGVGFFKRHLLTVGLDMYVISFKDSDQRIANNNAFVGVSYTYAFID